MREIVDAQAYQAVFNLGVGEKVLEELSFYFYDIESYTRDDPYHTAYREGQRSVVRFILKKLSQLPHDGEQHDV